MNDGSDLVRALTVGEPPPSRVDLPRAIRAGRRRERLRVAAVAGAAAVAVLATAVVVNQSAGGSRGAPVTGVSVSPSPPAPRSTVAPPLGTCTLDDLDRPGVPTDTRDVVADPTGRIIVVGSRTPASDQLIVKITDGVPQTIDRTGSVVAVNRSGDFVGFGADGKGWLHRGGQFVTIPVPTGFERSVPVDLNDRGDVLLTLSSRESGQLGAVWSAERPDVLRFLEPPDGWHSFGVGIGEDGTVAGVLTQLPAQFRMEPAAWLPDGTLRRLPVPEGSNGAIQSINGEWVVASGLRWNLRTGAVDRLEGIVAKHADQYGRLFGLGGTTDFYRPAVWVNGTVSLLPADPERTAGDIDWVGDDGTRLTGTLNTLGAPNVRRVMWTCTG
ncbi:hypothetical protein ACFFX1_53965 [Dactylosporangium sucinum]|uniref:Uncharacterized protein n=1 Tax=Dactylosporangium sucinum TaxID=1424081 RepID=A0A917U609_9ACTN|nr:hypothetical protein [Dactylosporangium sucinum]GGM61206.1 hypothetical protein GCM10007977_073420 [Dactylosporangium sucinum]